MFDSKALKEFSDEKYSKLYLWWIDSSFGGWCRVVVRKFIKNPIFQVKRLWDWYFNVFKDDFDFDGHCLFQIIEYKLKRIEKVLLSGYSIQESKDMKALKVAIRLAGRLKEDKYDTENYYRMEKKWGELRMWTAPIKNSDSVEVRSEYDKVKTPEDKAMVAAERKAGYESSYKKMKRDEKRLYSILGNHLRNWWD